MDVLRVPVGWLAVVALAGVLATSVRPCKLAARPHADVERAVGLARRLAPSPWPAIRRAFVAIHIVMDGGIDRFEPGCSSMTRRQIERLRAEKRRAERRLVELRRQLAALKRQMAERRG